MNSLFERLENIIKGYDNFIVMGHKDPDLDSLGSCLGFCEIVESFNKKAYLFLNKSIPPIFLTINRLPLPKGGEIVDFEIYLFVVVIRCKNHKIGSLWLSCSAANRHFQPNE